jgi:hypothetical protein
MHITVYSLEIHILDVGHSLRSSIEPDAQAKKDMADNTDTG